MTMTRVKNFGYERVVETAKEGDALAPFGNVGWGYDYKT